MKNVFRVGFWAVAVAMGTGCMAEAMDETVEEASAELAAMTCATKAPNDAALQVPLALPSVITISESSADATYGSSDCPEEFVVDLTFTTQFRDAGKKHSPFARPAVMPTTKSACEATQAEVTLFEASSLKPETYPPGCTGLCQTIWVPDWVRRNSVPDQGQWVNGACELKAQYPYRNPSGFTRVVGHVVRNGISQRVEVGTDAQGTGTFWPW